MIVNNRSIRVRIVEIAFGQFATVEACFVENFVSVKQIFVFYNVTVLLHKSD